MLMMAVGYEVEGQVNTDKGDRCSVKERERSDSSGNKTWERGKDREAAKRRVGTNKEKEVL
jgi:hypothetical protein